MHMFAGWAYVSCSGQPLTDDIGSNVVLQPYRQGIDSSLLVNVKVFWRDGLIKVIATSDVSNVFVQEM